MGHSLSRVERPNVLQALYTANERRFPAHRNVYIFLKYISLGPIWKDFAAISKIREERKIKKPLTPNSKIERQKERARDKVQAKRPIESRQTYIWYIYVLSHTCGERKSMGP